MTKLTPRALQIYKVLPLPLFSSRFPPMAAPLLLSPHCHRHLSSPRRLSFCSKARFRCKATIGEANRDDDDKGGAVKAAKELPREGSEEKAGAKAVLCKFGKLAGAILSFCLYFVRCSVSLSVSQVFPLPWYIHEILSSRNLMNFSAFVKNLFMDKITHK